MYRKIYSHANSIRVVMMMMMSVNFEVRRKARFRLILKVHRSKYVIKGLRGLSTVLILLSALKDIACTTGLFSLKFHH